MLTAQIQSQVETTHSGKTPQRSKRRVACDARCRGLTIVETLAAVLIVAILASLLFPTVQKALQGGRKSACVSNLKQIGGAMALYATDNNQEMPPQSIKGVGTLSVILAPYAGGMKSEFVAQDIFYCPETVAQKSPPAMGYPLTDKISYKGWSGYFLSYAINASVHTLVGYEEDVSQPQKRATRKTEILIPSKTVSLMDLTLPWPQGGAPPSSTFAGASYFDPTSSSFSLGMHHGAVGNILFCDGHVESFGNKSKVPVATLPSQTEPWQ